MPRPEQEIAPGRGCAAALSSAPAEAGPRAAAPPPTRTPDEGIAEAERLLTEERARIGSDLHDPRDPPRCSRSASSWAARAR